MPSSLGIFFDKVLHQHHPNYLIIMPTKYLISLVIFCSLSAELFAQQEAMDELDKRDLLTNQAEKELKVVSASRSSKKLSDLPITIEVITGEEIRKNGYITLADALKHVQGMKVSQPGNSTEGEMFLMRGLIGNYYTKILLNSIPLQPSATGAVAIAEQLPIAQAERIEIIFGPASSIYGADAMAGVINIITQNEKEYNYANGNVVVDDYGFRHANFMAGGKFGKDKNVFKYSIYGNYADRPDLNISRDSALYSPLNYVEFLPFREEIIADPEGFFEQLQQNYPYYSGTVFRPSIGEKPQNSVLLGLQLSYRNWTFSFNEMYRQNHSAIGRTAVIFSHQNPNSYIGDRVRRFTLSYQKDWEKFSLTTNLSYNRYRMNPNSFFATSYSGFGGVSYKYAASDDVFGEVLLRYTSKRNWEWTLGISSQISGILPLTNDLEEPFSENVYQPFSRMPLPPHDLYEDFGLNPLLNTNLGGFVQVIKSNPRWTYILGLRADRNTAYENISNIDLLPTAQVRGSVQYRALDNLSFRVSLGSAVKAPSPSDAYVSLALPDTFFPQDSISYQQIPNTDLQPEVLSSVEFGSRYQINKKYSLELIFHTQNIDNKIIRIITPVDKEEYPKSVQVNSNFANFPIARTFLNDENTEASLTSLQLLLKGKDIVPAWSLNADISLTYSSGEEVLSSEQGTILEIDAYRTMPNFIGQFNIDFKPHQRWYVRLENVMMSDWYSRFLLPQNIINNANSTVDGYYTLDMTVRHELNKNLKAYLRVMNVFNANFGGIGATGFDVDLPYNPQQLRTFQFGLNFDL